MTSRSAFDGNILNRAILEACHALFEARDPRRRAADADMLESLIREYRSQHGIDASGTVVRHAPGDHRHSESTWEHGGRRPQLLTFDNDVSLLEVVKAELADPDTRSASIASAFCTRGMLNLLLDPLSEFIDSKRPLRLLTSVMGDFNDPGDLAHLKDALPEMGLRVYYPLSDGKRDFRKPPPPFHLKCFLFEKASGDHAMIVGSSNLTMGGLQRNHEWNYFTNREGNLRFHGRSSAFAHGLEQYDRYWQDDSIDATHPDFVLQYRERYRKKRAIAREVAKQFEATTGSGKPQPRAAQIEALASLAARRAAGIRKSAVIAATGMGKSYLAAFDYLASGSGRLLFLAHQENILLKARDTFREVLGKPKFGEILSGREKPADLAESQALFAMVQTLSGEKLLSSLPENYFDYIVVDEFHHACAESWLRVIERFQPRFLLGLTATPERMDGRDVLRLCDYDIAHETRLFDAIDREWLTPFQYYAIPDKTDYDQIRWTGRGYDEEDLGNKLSTDTRASLIVANLRRYLPSTGKIKALAFCASVGHARYMARRFNEEGLVAECVTGTTSIAAREEAITRLQDEDNPLQVVCSVDVFGEGVDIPAVTHVLFLRPTQSFTVFLQQLGRGLRLVPEKEFLVALDFVGNFRQSYVAPLALRGYHNVAEYMTDRARTLERKLPATCHVNVNAEVERIWDRELRELLAPVNRGDRLQAQYAEFRGYLDHSPTLMDFFANPAAPDPRAYIRHFGNWLRTKQAMGDIGNYEQSLIGAPGEALLQHLEKELAPSKSYKMVVLQSLLDLGGTDWAIEDIARSFLDWYLANPERISDWDELAREGTPSEFTIRRAMQHLVRMPLGRMAGTGGEYFNLDRENGRFAVRERYRGEWLAPQFRDLVSDRIRYGLARYFYRRIAEAEIPFTTARSGFTATFSDLIQSRRTEILSGETVTLTVEAKGGYSGDLTITIEDGNERTFRAQTPIRDLTRFPARIKAVASALARNKCHGKFRIVLKNGEVSIQRIP
jgi:superfamily II DNA or RNA helicase/HKD family nuclease